MLLTITITPIAKHANYEEDLNNMKKLLGIIVLGLLLIPALAISGTFINEDREFVLKTSSKSGFKLHKNSMGHNDYNFKYIKDKKKHVQENTINDLK